METSGLHSSNCTRLLDKLLLMVRLLTVDNKTLSQGISDILRNVQEKLQNSGKDISTTLVKLTRQYFTGRWPGSKHYDPNKVTAGDATSGDVVSGSANIDVPGVGRAYHDVTILPRLRKHLTIPMNREAYGKSATEFSDLFVVKKDDKAFLARQQGKGMLQFMYVLSDRVTQRKDSSIMPSDKMFAYNIFARIKASL